MRSKRVREPKIFRWLLPPGRRQEPEAPTMNESDRAYMLEIARKNETVLDARIQTNMANTKPLKNTCIVCGGTTKPKERLCGACYTHFGRNSRLYPAWLKCLIPNVQREVDYSRNNRWQPLDDETMNAYQGGIVYVKKDAAGRKLPMNQNQGAYHRPQGARHTAAAASDDNIEKDDATWLDPLTEFEDQELKTNMVQEGRTFTGISTGEFRENGYLDEREDLDAKIDEKRVIERFMFTLTSQEQEIYALYLDGYKQAEIAREVGVSQARISNIVSEVISRGKLFQN